MISMIRHLLPTGRAWRITSEKTLTKFFRALSSLIPGVISYADENIWGALMPSTTSKLDLWDDQFAFPLTDSPTDNRRARLSSVWSAMGGQSPRYIQDTLRNNGFNVYVHEWWHPGTERRLIYRCGNPRSICGRSGVVCLGALHTRSPLDYSGYLLVNKVAGATYEVTTDPDTWPHYLYIGGEIFGNMATVSKDRKDEFETLCLKIRPLQEWLFMMVEYI